MTIKQKRNRECPWVSTALSPAALGEAVIYCFESKWWIWFSFVDLEFAARSAWWQREFLSSWTKWNVSWTCRGELVKHTNRWHRLLSISKLQSIIKLPPGARRWKKENFSRRRKIKRTIKLWFTMLWRKEKQGKAERLDWLEAHNLICLCGLIGIRNERATVVSFDGN